MLTVDTVRLLLRLDEEDICDEELQQFINHFSLTTIGRLGANASKDPTIYENPIFQEAVMAAIACRLSLTDLAVIHSPSGYKVGNTSEDYQNTSLGNYGKIPSWCDQYELLIGNLAGKYSQMTDLQIFRRRGMSVRRKWCRDLD